MSQKNTNREHKIKAILESSSNIDAKTLQKYIDQKLSKEELHDVEKQLLNSDFASEAAEGFANSDFKVNIIKSTNKINNEIRKYNKQRGFYQNAKVWYAAASVVLVFVVVFGLSRGIVRLEKGDFKEQNTSETSSSIESDNLAINQPIEKAKESDLAINKNEEETVSEEIKKAMINKLEKGEAIVALEEKDKNTGIETNGNLSQTQDKKDFSTSDVWIAKKEKVTTQNPKAAYRSDSAVFNQLADEDYIYPNMNRAAVAPKTPQEALFKAIERYENKKYTEAILLFETYLSVHPRDEKALFFGGLAYYQNHNYSKAISSLKSFLNNQPTTIFYQNHQQEANWYLANAYLNKEQKQEAQKLLEQIINSKSKYAKEAKSLLKN